MTFDFRVGSLHEAAASSWRIRTRDDNAEQLTVKIFADGADRASMLELYAKPYIKGLTTNPTLMRKAGVANYRAFAHEVLAEISDKPVCFEVLADDFADMERQALEIAGWADNVYVKIPITNTRRDSCCALVKRLADRQVKLNVTAIMTLAQVQEDSGGAESRHAKLRVGVRRSHCRHGRGSDSRSCVQAVEILKGKPAGGAHVGQSARDAQYLSGGRGRLPGDHRHRRIFSRNCR